MEAQTVKHYRIFAERSISDFTVCEKHLSNIKTRIVNARELISGKCVFCKNDAPILETRMFVTDKDIEATSDATWQPVSVPSGTVVKIMSDVQTFSDDIVVELPDGMLVIIAKSDVENAPIPSWED